MEPLRLGLVGVGGMGGEHLKQEHGVVEDVRFIALCDVNAALVEEKGRQYNLPPFVDYRAMIDSGLCEAVLIATPHPFHAPVAIYAAERGVHVLCEKPMATSVSEADAMIDAARKGGSVLGVMFQERTLPIYRTAHRLSYSEALGPHYRSVLIASHWFRSQRYYDSGAWRGTWEGEGGGVLMNQAPHSLDLLLWLGGQPGSVTAQTFTRGHRIQVEDTVSALLDYGGGHTGYLYITTAQYPGQMRLELSGELGQIIIEGERLRFYRLERPLAESLRDEPIFEMPAGNWEDVPLDDAGGQDHAEVVRRFARAISAGTPLVADGMDGLRSLELANALLLSGYVRQTVTLPLDRAAYDTFLAERRARSR